MRRTLLVCLLALLVASGAIAQSIGAPTNPGDALHLSGNGPPTGLSCSRVGADRYVDLLGPTEYVCSTAGTPGTWAVVSGGGGGGGSDGLGPDGDTGDIIVGGSGTTTDIDEIAVEAELEAVLDLQDMQGAVTDAQVPNNITVDAATSATTAATATAASALAANGANCPAGQYPLGVDTSGAVEGCTADSVGVPADAISPAATDGTGAVGVGTDYAREDHRHPTQTSSNTPSAATGDVSATNVQAAIAELASEKLAAASNNDTADDLSNNNLTDLADVVITSPANTQVLTHNGTNWVNAAAPGFTPSAPLTVQLGDMEGSLQFNYADGALTQIVTAGTDPWDVNANNDTSCFTADIAGANRGRITYTCASQLLVNCEWRMNGIVASTGALDGEGLWIGLGQNSARAPLSEHYVDVETTAPTTGSGFMLTGDASGSSQYLLSQNDTINLYSLGYASAGTLVAYNTVIECEQAGSTGQAGANGTNGGELLRLWLEAPSNGTIANFHRNVTTQTATAVYCITDTGTADVQLSVDDGTPANMFASPLACSSTEASTSTFGGANGAALPAGSYIEPVLTNVTGSPGSITITVVP